jgi:hypothetical protein
MVSRPAQVVIEIEPEAVSYEDAGRMLGVGRTKAWQLAKEGKIKTIKIGADDKVVVASIRRFVADLAASPPRS